MATHGTLDVVVHLHRFRNVDLFSRGIYMIRVSAKTKGSDRAGIPRDAARRPRRLAVGRGLASRGRPWAGVARATAAGLVAAYVAAAPRGRESSPRGREAADVEQRRCRRDTASDADLARKRVRRRGRRRGPCAKTGPPTRPATRTLGENGSAVTRPATRWTKTVPRRPQVQLLLEADDAVDVRAAPGDPVLARQVAAAGASRRRDI